ncbi:MAG TPA: heme o synthase [Thermoanaerobaculaceae bacterium]|nr:heme o synthase [Thermoanaerobaculaceae bacterium]
MSEPANGEATVRVAEAAAAGPRPPRQPDAWRRVARAGAAYAELTKLRLTALVVTTAAVGFALASGARWDVGKGLATLAGTALAAAGAMALNQRIESARDARMERTRLRPLPTGAIGARTATAFGVAAAGSGLALLALAANLLTAALGLAVVLLYTLVYTPLKARTPFCTLFGAVCGALPPMMGWSAAAGRLGFGAWVLGGLLFLWQIPHFLALAWLYREDYRRGGFRMLPILDPEGVLTGSVVVVYSLALVPVGIVAALGGLTGWAFAAGALVLGAGLVVLALRLAAERSDRPARRLFLATLAYLPLLLGLMVADRVPPGAPGAATAVVAAGRTAGGAAAGAPAR